MLEKLDEFMNQVGRLLAFGLAAAGVYVAGPFPLMDQGLRLGGSIALSVVIVILLFPLAHRTKNANLKIALWVLDLLLIAGFLFSIRTFSVIYEDFWTGIFTPETLDLLIGLFGALMVVEAVRRSFGPILPSVCILAIIYVMFGGGLPGIFSHSGFDLEQTVTTIWYGFDGVFTRPTDIVSSIVLIFIIFGAILEATGATHILLKMAMAATGKIRGGTAHAAIVASAMFGTISGSPVANVVGTGVFTIPMIRKQKFSNSFAGGVEAAASSGGQFTPPIMGAVAFVMADVVGQPYHLIAIAAILPALFFYFSLFASVYVEAVRLDIKPSKSPGLTIDDWIESLRFFVPLVIVVAVLFAGRSPAMAGFYSIIMAIATGLAIDILTPSKRGHIKKYPLELLKALKNGGRSCAQIMATVGSIGIVIGAVKLTGVAGEFALLVAELAQGTLFTALLATMLACLVLGMGLPTIPAYIFIVLFVGPSITKMGIEPLLVHMFVLYYGVLSNVTPPVAIAAYAAAPIALANPMSTGFQAIKISIVGFLIPFALIYNPSLSLVFGFEWIPFFWIMLRLPVAVWLIATAFIGCDATNLGNFERILRLLTSVAVIYNDTAVQIPALLIGVAMIGIHRLKVRSKNLKEKTAGVNTVPDTQ